MEEVRKSQFQRAIVVVRLAALENAIETRQVDEFEVGPRLVVLAWQKQVTKGCVQHMLDGPAVIGRRCLKPSMEKRAR